MGKPQRTHDYTPETEDFLNEVLEGLQRDTKQICSKFFYDEAGSRLFERITELDEYYPTRTETAIMQQYIDEMVERVGDNAMLIEYGSGSSEKTTILLDHLHNLAAYVPVDISKEHLEESARRVAALYPHIDVIPVAADYSDAASFKIPRGSKPVSHRVIFYPGSTIGNFHPREAIAFLARMRNLCGANGGIILGVDVKKDPGILHAAYNDREGVTAEFNLNILRRINHELDADFDLSQWKHRAIYDADLGRVEMHLVSLAGQTVTIDDTKIQFKTGESIWTESSYKYSLVGFEKMAAEAGLRVAKVWTDDDALFSVQYLRSQ
jgi:dimethylhistidine N-methyltransferase